MDRRIFKGRTTVDVARNNAHLPKNVLYILHLVGCLK